MSCGPGTVGYPGGNAGGNQQERKFYFKCPLLLDYEANPSASLRDYGDRNRLIQYMEFLLLGSSDIYLYLLVLEVMQ